MKLSKSYFFTLREDVKDEDSKSGNLLVRSGMIKKVSSGIYMFLPLGLRVLDKIRYIVKDEMDKAGAQELLMPSLIPREVYDTCGRTEAFGNDMFNLNDRYEKPYVLGPTHEELFTIAAKSMVQSYKDLHDISVMVGVRDRNQNLSFSFRINILCGAGKKNKALTQADSLPDCNER